VQKRGEKLRGFRLLAAEGGREGGSRNFQEAVPVKKKRKQKGKNHSHLRTWGTRGGGEGVPAENTPVLRGHHVQGPTIRGGEGR